MQETRNTRLKNRLTFSGRLFSLGSLFFYEENLISNSLKISLKYIYVCLASMCCFFKSAVHVKVGTVSEDSTVDQETVD